MTLNQQNAETRSFESILYL